MLIEPPSTFGDSTGETGKRLAMAPLSLNLEDVPSDDEGNRRNDRGKGRAVEDEQGDPTMDFLRKVGGGSSFGAQNNVSVPLEIWQALLKKLEKAQEREHNVEREMSYERGRPDREMTWESQERGEKWVTQEEVMRMLDARKDTQQNAFDLDPPYPPEIARRPYPLGYQVPTFRKFDGSSSAREHLMSFVDDLGVHRENRELRLKEFSKSLVGSAFTWYTKLHPGSIRTWEELATEFCNKFLEEEGVIHIMDLGRVKQRSNEGLTAFIKRYRDKALQCKETLPEADLVYGCIQNIEGESQLFLSVGRISTFAELLRRAANVSESLRHQGKRLKDMEPVYEVYATEGRSKGRRRDYDDHLRRGERRTRQGPFQERDKESNGSYLQRMEELPPISLSMDEMCQLVEQWLDEGLLEMKAQGRKSTNSEKRDREFCFIHGSRTHGLKDCHQVKRLFYKQLKEGRQV